MYKTIRHGENSLQYTILPQHDDYKGIDGKSRSHRSGRKKRNLMAFIGLFFVCSIITGAILVPLMVSVEFMASPTAWFQHRPLQIGSNATKQATLALIKNERIKSSSKLSRINNSTFGDGRATQSTIVTYPTTDLPPSTQTTTSTTSTTTAASTTTVTVTSTPSSTSTVEPTVNANLNLENTEPETTKTPDATTVIGNGKHIGQQNSEISFDSAKSVNQIRNMNKSESAQAPKNWLKSHWPIVDPSTYFQWTVFIFFFFFKLQI